MRLSHRSGHQVLPAKTDTTTRARVDGAEMEIKRREQSYFESDAEAAPRGDTDVDQVATEVVSPAREPSRP